MGFHNIESKAQDLLFERCPSAVERCVNLISTLVLLTIGVLTLQSWAVRPAYASDVQCSASVTKKNFWGQTQIVTFEDARALMEFDGSSYIWNDATFLCGDEEVQYDKITLIELQRRKSAPHRNEVLY
jgi:Tfp pilus assembly protein PilV